MENAVKTTAVKRKQNVRKLTALGMLGAISLILVATVHFPIIPAAPFLEYDPADVPILIGTFAFGPVAGFLLTVVVSIIQGMTVSAASGGPIGIIMHFLATGTFVLLAGNLYRAHRTRKAALLGLAAGIGALVALEFAFDKSPIDNRILYAVMAAVLAAMGAGLLSLRRRALGKEAAHA